MAEIIDILWKPVEFALEFFQFRVFGISLYTIAIGFFVISTVVRFIIVPFFGGKGISSGSSDQVKRGKK